MKKKTKEARERAYDHCRWHYGKKPALLKACREGAKDAIDEARHVSKSLGAISDNDLLDAIIRVESYCPRKWKTTQYVPICRKTVRVFFDKIADQKLSKASPRETTEAILSVANEVDRYCRDTYSQDQYRSVCTRVVAGLVRELARKADPARFGR